ncbi:MAG TPA: nicotinate (nicotinamide) nucleotide adenylyltransferase [Candidatus Onthousia faecavium]|nr:nicotinate (nicotinamide) nucleotide adenylyltransferase [Candidatus Onthousia faecavium]
MKIGIFGGSFNPPHKMHQKIALDLIKKGYVDKIIFVPTGAKYSYKSDLLDPKIRYKMLTLLCQNNRQLSVSDYELKEQVVYTYETLDYFKKLYKHDEIYFICGTDNLSYLDKWKHGLTILKNNKFLIIKRKSDNLEPILEKYKDYKDNLIITSIKEDGLSSTYIREQIKRNGFNSIKDYVPKEIYQYLSDHKLYLDNKISWPC